jgi:hypothetical protein
MTRPTPPGHPVVQRTRIGMTLNQGVQVPGRNATACGRSTLCRDVGFLMPMTAVAVGRVWLLIPFPLDPDRSPALDSAPAFRPASGPNPSPLEIHSSKVRPTPNGRQLSINIACRLNAFDSSIADGIPHGATTTDRQCRGLKVIDLHDHHPRGNAGCRT